MAAYSVPYTHGVQVHANRFDNPIFKETLEQLHVLVMATTKFYFL